MVMNRVFQHVFRLVLFLGANYLAAQDPRIDSLKRAWHTEKNDTNICKALNQLASKERSEGWQKYYIELQQRADKGLANAQDTTTQKFYKFQIYCAKEYAAYFERLKGNNDLSIRLHEEAYKYAEELQKVDKLANINNSIALLYYFKADARQALYYYEKALHQYEQVADSAGMSKALNNIGTVHNDFGDKESALKFFKEALHYSLAIGNVQIIASGYNNIGSVLADQHKYQEALGYFEKARDADAKAGLLYEEGIALTNMGNIHQMYRNFSKALMYYEQGLVVCIQSENTEGIATCFCYLADIHYELNNKAKTKEFATKALDLGRVMGSPDILSKAAFQLARLFKESNDYKNAFEMNELYMKMKDSIRNEDAQRIVMRSQFQFEYGKKAATDSLKTVKDKQVLSLQIQQQKTQKLFLFSFLGLAVLLGGFIYNRYRVTQNQKLIIETNNKDLERQHRLNQKIFSVISHDFRGPMLSLSLLLNSFKKNKPSPELSPYLDELGSQLNSSNAMMDNLLNWARTELQVNVQEKSMVRLLDTVREIEHQLHTNLEHKKIKLEKNITEEASLYFPAEVLKIVLRNVLNNAIKFSYEKSSIHLLYDAANNELRIIDHGVGMSEEKIQQLFKKDVLSSPGTNYENGFGMGLYLVSELLQKHGARIAVKSEPNKGSEFVITFGA
jgi:two-component system sensor histidine kinase/response regulator